MEALKVLIQQNPVNIPLIGLTFARSIAYPNLDVDRYMYQIDRLADEANSYGIERSNYAVGGEQLLHFLREEVGFRGATTTYYKPEHSYLNFVLDEKVGIPISLAVIYISVAKKLGFPAHGVGLPGHFITRVGAQGEFAFIDLFNGTRISARECARLVRDTTGYQGVFKPEWLNPSSPISILERMLNNLRLIYMQSEAWNSAERVIQNLRIIRPNAPDYFRDEGIISISRGNVFKGVQLIEEYLTQLPEAPDAEVLKKTLGPAVANWAKLN